MIRAGAAGVHFEDQLSSAKKCGHMGGKVLVPTQDAINKLVAARLAADVMGVPTVLIARTDADAANLLQSDYDQRDRRFLTGERTTDGFYRGPRRPRPGHRSRPVLRALCRPALVRDLQARSRPGASASPRPFTRSSRTSCCPTTARRPSTGRPTCRPQTTAGLFGRSSPPWATASSSSRWPAGTRSTCRCSSWPGPTASAACSATRNCRSASLPAKSTASAPPSTRPSSAPATSTPCRP